MKSYPFIQDKDYQNNFIKRYEIKDGTIIAEKANGQCICLFYNPLVIKSFDETMAKQVNIAYDSIQEFKKNCGKEKTLEYFKKYVFLKARAKDVYKNKLLLDHLDEINSAFQNNDKDWIYSINNKRIQDCLLLEFYRPSLGKINLSDADFLTYNDVKEIIKAIPEYYRSDFEEQKRA